jgi:sugar-specific transcriptional regulator TrmB
MSSLDQLAKKLSAFGITFNQARIYITASQMGIASVKDISKKSNVPREEIYRLLPKLEKLGLLEKILGKPIKVKATPFEAALSLLIKRENYMNSQRVSKLKAEKGELLKDIQKFEIKNDSEGKAHFTLISQRDAVIQKIFSMIDAAEKTVDLALSRDQFIHFFTSHMPLIKKNLSRGLNFRVVLEKCEYDDLTITVLKEYNSSKVSFSVRFVDQQLNSYFVVDYK